MSKGYSGTPLAKKLGLKDGFKALLVNAPDHYFSLFTDPPPAPEWLKEAGPESVDFIHLFCKTMEGLESAFARYRPAMKKSGMLWVSWPKGSSGISTNLKRDWIRDYLLGEGLVDVKVAAIDEDWSGLKFVYRLEDR